VHRLGPRDQFDLVELNGAFVDLLRRRFAEEPSWRAVAERTRILHQRLEDVAERGAYDVIVSGLPLNNFAAADVERILAAFASLARPGGTLSFFEYVAVRPVRAALAGADERQRLRDVGRLLGNLLGKCEIRRECILVNMPPAWVHHVRLGVGT
jgi:phospholipid N-methyltransferase